ncbi:MAG: glycosyltransferase family 4 protein [Anaerolineae bacterium]|nr:glycosyltransferase family 4 protein [Anaerolineae bacterium]
MMVRLRITNDELHFTFHTMCSSRRILMIAPTSFFLDYGCHIRILEEARALLAQGMEVRIVTYYLGRDWPGLDIARCSPTPWRADYEVGSSRHKIAFDVLLSWRALIETLHWRPHLIHGHLHEGALIGYVLSKIARVPLVFDFQGSLTGEMTDHGFIKEGSVMHYWWRRLEERIVEMPDVIVTSTIHSAELLAHSFGREEGVIPLPDSVNLDYFCRDCFLPEEKSARRTQLGIPQDRTLIVYLGLLADYQGIPQLLQAAADLRARDLPVSFLIMGFPNVEGYRQQAYTLGLTAQDVIFTGKVPYEEAPQYLVLGDIAVAPKISATEGSGKILNYIALQLPVVAYDTPVSREYLGSLGVYASPIGDAPALARAIEMLVRNPKIAKDLGELLRERAGRHFSWERSGRKLLQVYEKLWTHSGKDERQ